MIFKNFTNAFVRLESGPSVVLCDVWRYPVWDGGWTTLPLFTPIQLALKGATHCFISHLHEDHCDPLALAFLPRNTVMIAPKAPPNHLIKIRLETMGFTDVRLVNPSEPYNLQGELWLEIVPPLNRYAQEEEYYRDGDQPHTGIDCGAVFSDSDGKIVLLSDNSPYNLADAGSTLKTMRGADVLAFPFNGYSDDYPVCYDNFTLEEKRRIARERGEKRLRMTAPNLMALEPKFLVPYSSDFLVHGPRALEFVDVQPDTWMDRESAARSYEAATGIAALAVHESDEIEIEGRRPTFRKGVGAGPRVPIRELATSEYNATPNTRFVYRPVASIEQLATAIERSAQNMFAQMTARRLRSSWTLVLEIVDHADAVFVVDLENHAVGRRGSGDRKALTCKIESNYLNAILTGRASWNGAQGSYNLTWTRVPADFDFHLYRSIHFFNIPGSGSLASSSDHAAAE